MADEWLIGGREKKEPRREIDETVVARLRKKRLEPSSQSRCNQSRTQAVSKSTLPPRFETGVLADANYLDKAIMADGNYTRRLAHLAGTTFRDNSY